MYVMEINKFGIKEYYSTPIIAKLHRKLKEKVSALEFGITDKEIQEKETLGYKLKPIKVHETLKLKFRNTEVIIRKTEAIPTNYK